MKSPESEDHTDAYLQKGHLTYTSEVMLELLEAVLERGKPFRTPVAGFSMSPFIKDGDVITLASLGLDVPRLGEVVAYRRPQTQKPVVHRVVQPGTNKCLIQGDAVGSPDGFIPREAILARVVKVERKGKRVRFSVGPERVLIAYLTRTGLFLRVIIPVWMRIRPFVRRNRRPV